MKKTIFIIALTFTVGLSFNSCKKETKNEIKKEVSVKNYQCPMDCEHGKTYTEPGKCPVCKMDLKEKQ